MARRFQRAEVWTDVVGNSGTRVAVIPCTTCQTTERFEGIVATPALTLSAPRTWAGRAELTVQRVIRLLFDDASFDEYRITGLVDATGEGEVQVTGAGMILDLATQSTLVSATTAPELAVNLVGTPTACLTTIDGFAPAWWAVGTVTPTVPLDLTVTNATPLAAAIAVAEAANLATGTTYEMSARRNGTSGYYLDLTAYNSSATIPDIRTGKNLVRMQRDQRATDLVTRVVPVVSTGEPAVGDNWWSIAAVSAGSYIDVVDVAGGLSPLLEADALNGLYVVDKNNGTHAITDSVVQSSTTARLSMASTTDLVAGDWCRIAATSTPTDVTRVDAPTAQAAYGVRVRTIPGLTPTWTNRVKNADLRDGTSTTPTDWSVTGGAAWSRTTTTGEWVTGGAAYKNVGAGTNSTLSTSAAPLYLNGPYGGGYYDVVQYRVRLYVTAWAALGVGNNFLSLQISASGATIPLDGTDSAYGLDTLDSWIWVTYNQTWTAPAAGNKTPVVSIQTWATDSFRGIIDCAQVSVARNVLPASLAARDFYRGSGGATNWLAGVMELRAKSSPPKSYTVTLRDLHRANPTTWADDQLVHGGTCTVTDTDLGEAVSLRAVALTTNHLEPLDTKVTFSTRTAELTGLLLGA